MKPKFKIDDIVCMNDNFSFNPSDKVVSVGKVVSIHMHHGKGLFSDSNNIGLITYSISGFSLMPKEKDLQLWNGETYERR